MCILGKWINDTRNNYGVEETDELYYLPGFGSLKVNHLNMVMQLTIDSLNLPGCQKRATSHSLRYSRATMMAAAGFPHYIIAMYGGFKDPTYVH